MFVDEVTVLVKSGNGGNGAVSFRKEKFVPRGGPNGGDGGKGGDVVIEGDSNLSTLLDFRYQQRYEAAPGANGTSKDMHGKDATDLIMKVPIGTVATDTESSRVMADITKHGQRVILAPGGQGGRGNARFVSSTHQAPKFAENGEPGITLNVKLELKLLADIGLIGFPNVGKSTLIAAVSAAKPKIADYPFTTLVPNLGVVRVDDERSFVMADIPGLIEGASSGVGLGHQFLRHVERTRVLVHLVDVCGLTGRDPVHDYRIINDELAAYSPELAALPQLVALNKIDLAESDLLDSIEEAVLYEMDRRYPLPEPEVVDAVRPRRLFRISAATRQGVADLVYACGTLLSSIPTASVDEDEVVRITADRLGDRRRDRRWHAARDENDGAFLIYGPGLERLVSMTNLENEAAVTRLQRTLDRSGVVTRLRQLGAKQGDTVRIGTIEFDFVDEDVDEGRRAGKAAPIEEDEPDEEDEDVE
ncbi:MAG: GTPase ObgE [Capsulimonadaceae bacterium]